jgi:hypothetical protein
MLSDKKRGKMSATVTKSTKRVASIAGSLEVEGKAGGAAVPISGTVKGVGFEISVPLTVTNGAYSIGDVVGGLITLPGAVSAAGKHGYILGVTLAGVAALAYHLWFVNADLAAGTVADNAPFAPAAGDLAKVQGIYPIAVADYAAPQSAFNVTSPDAKLIAFSCVGTTLYAYLVADATTTPGTTTLILTVKGEWVD